MSSLQFVLALGCFPLFESSCLPEATSRLLIQKHTKISTELGQRRPSRFFKTEMDKLWQQDQNGSAPFDNASVRVTGRPFTTSDIQGDVKIVVGITTISSEREVRKVHRSTWMQTNGVCRPGKHDDPSCFFFPTFILGERKAMDSLTLEEASKYNDMLFLDGLPEISSDGCFVGDANNRGNRCLENMAQKVYYWFRNAVDLYPWATFVAKMESDVFPRVQSIYVDFRAAPQRTLYYGNFWTEDTGDTHQPSLGTNCTGGSMQGGFYAISWDLVHPVIGAMPGPPTGALHEDAAFGSWVFDALSQKRTPYLTCINVGFGDSVDVGRWKHPV